MTELRPSRHALTGAVIVEVWEDGVFIATIYPAHRGVRVVSKYLDPRATIAVIDPTEPPALFVWIWSGVPR